MTKKEQSKERKLMRAEKKVEKKTARKALKAERKVARTERKTTEWKLDVKGMVFGVLTFVALVIVVVAIVKLNGRAEEIPEFKTDETKIVMTMNAEMATFEESEYEPKLTHIVYFHDGEKITNVKVYYEYETEDEAREALDKITMDYYSGKKLEGKYIVLQAKRDEYDGLTVEYMEEQYDYSKAAGIIINE